jgi:hypothetical protein
MQICFADIADEIVVHIGGDFICCARRAEQTLNIQTRAPFGTIVNMYHQSRFHNTRALAGHDCAESDTLAISR